MNFKLLQPAVRDYLIEHLHFNAATFLLKSHPFENISTQELTQQLIGLQKARLKFEPLFINPNIIFPPKINLEQTSSWSTATYKANLYNGENMIDLTGGFGIDISAFAKAYTNTTHIELNKDLQKLAAQLFTAQELTTKSYTGDGLQYLTENASIYDLIYIDPSRKTDTKSKAIQLEDYEPNVIENLDLLLSKGKKVMIKTSPMLDITAGLKQLKNVCEIHIVAVKNDVKELLWILDKNANEVIIHCVNLESQQPDLVLNHGDTASIELSEPLDYLYEPNAAVMKSQAFSHLCEKYGISKIDQDAHLFTGKKSIDFPGRTFIIEEVKAYKPKDIKRSYGKSHRAVVTRNFRESVHQLRTKYQLKEHETDYLFFTSSMGKPIVIQAKKL
ncbi:methyltransferase [Nonlabens arenilitoris]|uniref:Methyltransferase n=1 Tax=Nonlabens arenilitoris TaxID=1217969 RepID=A0A2S7U7H3_9FLAO|nr:methyltransferase [Nonlabens arenilitoris]PQJ30461.1 methyltransferase [Nonlabens arenilitoris]